MSCSRPSLRRGWPWCCHSSTPRMGCVKAYPRSELRLAPDANPSQLCRLPAQHQPTFGALRLAGPSRPVPLLIHSAGVRASSVPPGLRRRDPRHEAAATLQRLRTLQQPVQPLRECQRSAARAGDGGQCFVRTPVRHGVAPVDVVDEIQRRIRQRYRGNRRELVHIRHVGHHEALFAIHAQHRNQR